MTGTHPYASAHYANAFVPDYEPIFLQEAQTYVLKRAVPGTPYYDAMGCYPLCVLSGKADMEKDFLWLREQGIVSLVLVTDPFFHPPLSWLEQFFDKVSAYKRHYVHDFSKERPYSKHHRYEVRRALRDLDVKQIALSDYIDEWVNLYDALVEKHSIAGIQAFPRQYFENLLPLGPVMFGAFSNDTLVSAYLCIRHEAYGYGHLAASSQQGYRLRATFAVYDRALQFFSNSGAKAFDLGAGAGLADTTDGLTQFKQGFSNADAPCYLCGKILDKKIYEELSAGKKTEFFPAYRG